MQTAKKLDNYFYNESVELFLYENEELIEEAKESESSLTFKSFFLSVVMLVLIGVLPLVWAFVLVTSKVAIYDENKKLQIIENQINEYKQKTSEVQEQIENKISVEKLQIYAMERLDMVRVNNNNRIVLNAGTSLSLVEGGQFMIASRAEPKKSSSVIMALAERLAVAFY